MGIAWSGGKEGLFWDREFSKKHQAGYAFSPGTFSVGDFSALAVSDTPNSTNSQKTDTIISGILQSGAQLTYPGLNRRRKSPLIAPIGRQNPEEAGGRGSTSGRSRRLLLKFFGFF
jgi:hypothetical protein